MKPAVHVTAIVAALLLSSGCSIIEASGPDSASANQSSRDDTSNDNTSNNSTSNDGTSSDSTTSDDSAHNGDDAPPPQAPTIPELEKPAWVDQALTLTPIAELTEPTAFSPRSGFEHLYIGERSGIIRLVERSFNKNGVERISLSRRVVLDISETVSVEGEGGLLGLAFSTDGRYLFVSYTDLDGDLVVDEYTAGRGTRPDVNSKRELLRVPQPFANHNGGQLALGSDGFLYIGVGDGGGSYDPDGNGQDTSTLLGSILRIDTFAGGDDAYSIPAGNPLVDDDAARPEIFAWGLRNPWRFSFDLDTGDLWLPDLGQDSTEEINFLSSTSGGGRGVNLGWGNMEGYLSVDGAPEPVDHHLPIHAYDHEQGRCSVTGGFVYRGSLAPELTGAYIFGDFCSGEIFGLHHVDGVANAWPLTIATAKNQLASFGQGSDGEIYVLQLDGQISRIELAAPETDG